MEGSDGAPVHQGSIRAASLVPPGMLPGHGPLPRSGATLPRSHGPAYGGPVGMVVSGCLCHRCAPHPWPAERDEHLDRLVKLLTGVVPVLERGLTESSTPQLAAQLPPQASPAASVPPARTLEGSHPPDGPELETAAAQSIQKGTAGRTATPKLARDPHP